MVLLILSLSAACPAEGLRKDLDITIHDGLFRDSPDGSRYPFYLQAEVRDGQWGFVYGTALDFNNGEHIGRMDEFKIEGDKLTARLALKIMGDPWTPGGRIWYDISATRNDQGEYEGSFSGTFQKQQFKGTVTLELSDPRQPAKDYVPLKPDERPRVLFRKHQLDDLRKKTKTPFGQAALARMKVSKDPIALGLAYQLTGDQKYAQAALKQARIVKSDFGPGAFSVGHVWGERMMKVALAFDLCYDAWDDEAHSEMETYFNVTVPMLYWQMRRVTRKANWAPASNYSGPMRGGASIASLVLWGIPSDRPVKPLPPATSLTIAPAKDYSPAKGVPVSEFKSGQMPGDWIYVGGFKPELGEDPLKSMGGVEKARPRVGETIDFRGRKEAWRHISREKDKGYWRSEGMMGGKDMIDITNAIGREYFSTSFFYTVIRNDKPRWVRIVSEYSKATFFLNGTEVQEGGYVKIDKGLYPIMVAAPIDRCEAWGRHLMQPKLIETTQDDADAYKKVHMTEYERQLKDWRYAVNVWENTDKINPKYTQWLHLGRRHMWRFYRQGIGDGGFQPETGSYSVFSTREPMTYASFHQSMFGYDVTGRPDMEMFLPRKLMAMVFKPGGEIRAQDINGTPYLNVEHTIRAFPIVPRKYKPAVLWYWNRQTGVNGEHAKALNHPLALSYVHYPLGEKAAHPGDVMPLTWRADTFGYYCFRNAWKGEDDFVFQAFAKAHHIGGWNHPNAGTIRLMGLGRIWATGPSSRGADRWQEPVVEMPNDEIDRSACGQVTYVQTREDGSGVVSFDLIDLYAGRKKGERKYSRHGFRNPDALGDTGITGMRSVAIDYSQASGTPALLAVVDKISGGGKKIWKWQLPGNPKDKKDLKYTVKIEGNSFTMDYGDVSLKMTFLAPADVKISHESGRREYTYKSGSKGGQKTTREVNAIHATAGDGTVGEFFVVGTIQKKGAPAVKIRGRGLNAKATIGKQNVSFDGKKIVLEK